MSISEQSISYLIEMGFEREEALKALEITGGDIEAAIEHLSIEEERYKLVFLVRTDLNMGVGKIAAQVGHATLGAYKQCSAVNLQKWEDSGQAKIVLQVDSLEQMLQLEQCAKAVGLMTHCVEDAGRTQIEAGSITVCAIGPDADSKINQVTGALKLFR